MNRSIFQQRIRPRWDWNNDNHLDMDEFLNLAWYSQRAQKMQEKIKLCDSEGAFKDRRGRVRKNRRLERFELLRCIYKVFPETRVTEEPGSFERARAVALQTDVLLWEAGAYNQNRTDMGYQPRNRVTPDELIYVVDHWDPSFDVSKFPMASMADFEAKCTGARQVNSDGIITTNEARRCLWHSYRSELKENRENKKYIDCKFSALRRQIMKGVHQVDNGSST